MDRDIGVSRVGVEAGADDPAQLSVRATNCLESENIHTVRDLVRRNEDQLLEVRNFGETTLKEVKGKLEERNLKLGMRIAKR